MEESSNQPLKASDSQAIHRAKLQHNILLTKFGMVSLKSLRRVSISFPSPVCMNGAATLTAILARESKPLETSTQITSKHFLVR